MTTASDPFTRANNADLGTSWDQNTNSFAIFSNRARPPQAHLDCVETWNANVFGANQFSRATLGVFTGIGANNLTGIGVGIRWSAGTTKTGYWITANEHLTLATTIIKFIAGTPFVLGQANANWEPGDVIELEGDGNTLLGKRNGLVIMSVSGDTGIVGVRPAICFSATTSIQPALEDWSGGDTVDEPEEGAFLMGQAML